MPKHMYKPTILQLLHFVLMQPRTSCLKFKIWWWHIVYDFDEMYMTTCTVSANIGLETARRLAADPRVAVTVTPPKKAGVLGSEKWGCPLGKVKLIVDTSKKLILREGKRTLASRNSWFFAVLRKRSQSRLATRSSWGRGREGSVWVHARSFACCCRAGCQAGLTAGWNLFGCFSGSTLFS